jgi:hypothetical protein
VCDLLSLQNKKDYYIYEKNVALPNNCGRRKEKITAT